MKWGGDLKIAFDGQFFLKGNKTGVAWSADNIIRHIAQWKNISRQISESAMTLMTQIC